MIPLYGAAAGSNQIYRLDDPARATDSGEQVAAGLWGDVNDDGVVDALDATELARYSTGLSVTNLPALLWRGDVTQDGNRNIIDAQQIARFVAGLSHVPLINTAREGNGVAAAVAIEAYLESAPIERAAFMKLRRIVQRVSVPGETTIRITALVNGAEREDQAQSKVFDTSLGEDQLMEAPTDVDGSRFAFRLDVDNAVAGCGIGATTLSLVPKRSTVGG